MSPRDYTAIGGHSRLNAPDPHSLREGMVLILEHVPESRTAPPLTFPPDVFLPVFQRVG